MEVDFIDSEDREEKRFSGWMYHLNPYEIWLLKREDRRTKVNIYISHLAKQKCVIKMP